MGKISFTSLIVIIITSLLLLIYTASTVLDTETTYLLSFNTRIWFLIFFDVILGISAAKLLMKARANYYTLK